VNAFAFAAQAVNPWIMAAAITLGVAIPALIRPDAGRRWAVDRLPRTGIIAEPHAVRATEARLFGRLFVFRARPSPRSNLYQSLRTYLFSKAHLPGALRC
jgi:hypothetical protein